MEGQDRGDFLDWEIRDSHFPLFKHIIAGSCAGIMEHIGMYPLDTVKVSQTHLMNHVDSHASKQENNSIQATRAHSLQRRGIVPVLERILGNRFWLRSCPRLLLFKL